ncbi:hypothetical protein PCCS19_18860 [Paenibacillus sp. CCS19]|nr:hypothetical protein PCCS19_18860 [Paenibacillus cellulosilyticus]
MFRFGFAGSSVNFIIGFKGTNPFANFKDEKATLDQDGLSIAVTYYFRLVRSERQADR